MNPGFFMPVINFPLQGKAGFGGKGLALFSQFQVCLWCLLRFLDEAVQKSHPLPLHRKQDSGDALVEAASDTPLIHSIVGQCFLLSPAQEKVMSCKAESGALASYWQPHIEAWKSSWSTQQAYCKANDLSYHRFGYWHADGCIRELILLQFRLLGKNWLYLTH